MISKLTLGVSKLRYYHLIAGLDSDNPDVSMIMLIEQFVNNLSSPEAFLRQLGVVDSASDYLSVFPTVANAATALGVDSTFRRCISPEYKDKNNTEVYPVILLTYDLDFVPKCPTVEQSPDVKVTGERWIPANTGYSDFKLCWVNHTSFTVESFDIGNGYIYSACDNVKFIEPVAESIHPWLNGCGHALSDPGPFSAKGDLPVEAINSVVEYLQQWADNYVPDRDSKVAYRVEDNLVKFSISPGFHRQEPDELLSFLVHDRTLLLESCSDEVGYLVLDGCIIRLRDSGYTIYPNLG